jgi:hypothetical protein
VTRTRQARPASESGRTRRIASGARSRFFLPSTDGVRSRLRSCREASPDVGRHAMLAPPGGVVARQSR